MTFHQEALQPTGQTARVILDQKTSEYPFARGQPYGVVIDKIDE